MCIEAIFTDDWYNGQEEKISEYIGNKRSILVGMPRLRQLRVMKSKCFSFCVHQTLCESIAKKKCDEGLIDPIFSDQTRVYDTESCTTPMKKL